MPPVGFEPKISAQLACRWRWMGRGRGGGGGGGV